MEYGSFREIGLFAGAKTRAAASPFGNHFVKARRGRYGPPQMKIHPLISTTDELAALVHRMSPRLCRRGHGIHARKQLLARLVSAANRDSGRGGGDRPESGR